MESKLPLEDVPSVSVLECTSPIELVYLKFPCVPDVPSLEHTQTVHHLLLIKAPFVCYFNLVRFSKSGHLFNLAVTLVVSELTLESQCSFICCFILAR